MKNLTIAIIAALAIGQSALAEDTFRKGNIVVDLNLGIGTDRETYDTYNSNSQNPNFIDSSKKNRATFTQRLGVEFGVWNITDKSTLGIGFDITNSIGSTRHYISGTYDYSYVATAYNRGDNNLWTLSNTQNINREGVGTSVANASIADISFMIRVAYHREFIDNLDTYAGLGFGLACTKYSYSNYDHKEGFSRRTETLDQNYTGPVQLVYSYDDFDHVEWEKSNAMARFAFAAYIGARYYFNSHWAVNAEIGLPSVSFSATSPHYSIFTVGASYKF